MALDTRRMIHERGFASKNGDYGQRQYGAVMPSQFLSGAVFPGT